MGIFVGLFTAIVSAVSSGWNRYQERKEVEHQSDMEIRKAETQVQIKQLENEGSQIELNKINAASNSFFKSAPIPAAMWICVLAIGYHYIFIPFTSDILHYFGHNIMLTSLNMNEILSLLGGLLGLGTYRAVDKRNERAINLDREKFYASLRTSLGGKITKQQVDMVDKAIDASSN